VTAILQTRDLHKHFGGLSAVSDVNLEVATGEIHCLIGPNGAGKSTLLRAILGWHPLVTGTIRLGDEHPQHALPRLAYLPQRQAIDWDFPITVREVVEQGRFASLRFFQRLGREDHARVDRALEELALTDLADRQIRMLSGGQQQRVFLARAVAQGADIFLLDEPFAGLDLFAAEELTHILRAWETQGRTVLAAVHDLEVARATFVRAVLLDTTLVESGPIAAVLSDANIDRAFRHARCRHQHQHAAGAAAHPEERR
jgi:ABC-type Mn2+/Zn2+ transport system ATPase subunit